MISFKDQHELPHNNHLQRTGSILFIGNYRKRNPGDHYINDELVQRLRESGWQTHTTSNQKSRFLRLLDMIWTIFTKRKAYQLAEVDVFSGTAFIWAEISINLLHYLEKPVILTLHGGNLPQFAKKNQGRVAKLLKLASTVITPSPYLFEEFRTHCRKIQIIPNPIDIERYSFRQRNTLAPNLIWLRAFHEIYNPSLAPQILYILKERYPHLHLTMIGPDKGDGSLAHVLTVIEKLHVQEMVTIVGGIPREEVPIRLNESDIFVNTTNIDNTPVSIIEAMACGLCIVSTNVGGLPYLLNNNIDGLLVTPNDPSAMAAAIEKILCRPELAAKLSANARKKAESFSWDIIYPMWENLFVEVIDEFDNRKTLKRS